MNDPYRRVSRHANIRSPRRGVISRGPLAPKADERVDPSRTAFLTGGLGDIFAVESFLTPEHRTRLQKLYFGTRKWQSIWGAWKALPNYPSLTGYEIIWDDWSKFWCLHRKAQVPTLCAEKGLSPPSDFHKTADWSIAAIFDLVHRKRLAYTGSSFAIFDLCSPPEGLPEDFVCICPWSTDKRDPNRDFSADDWKTTIRHLERTGLRGVVLNAGPERVPGHPLLFDLTNRTSEPEAIEVVKRARGYLGIDSSLSVLATKLLPEPSVVVKSRNGHLVNHQAIYYAPRTDFHFVVPAISEYPPWEPKGR